MSGRVTLRVLAEHLRLSPASISLVLNQAPAAEANPPATQARIREAARAFDYRPNTLAKSLRRQAAGRAFTATAIGAIQALRDAGPRVPADVSVVGVDAIQSAAYQNPGLTTVRQPLRHMGELAARTILPRVAREGASAAARRASARTQAANTAPIVVAPELIIRGTTAVAARDRRR